jgi:LTXXQ motif family protein
MTPFVRVSLLTLVTAASLSAAEVAVAQTSGGPAAAPATESPKWMQRWVDDRTALFEARLAGLKAGLRLTPDQEQLWGPFESAVRDFAQMHMAHMQGMMERIEKGEGAGGPPPSPIDRLDMLATRLANAGAALKKIADAAKPLYASLDDQQKGMFRFLSHELMMIDHERGMGPMERGMGPMEHGMGTMGRGHEGSNEDEDEGDED